MKKPFVFIGGVMRTGTTLLQEMLTSLPKSYIMHEPWLGQQKFLNQDIMYQDFLSIGVDLREVMKGAPSVTEMFERLSLHIEQVGVKEIRLTGCIRYLNWFPDAKVILTGRDPRDIFLSCHYKLLRGDRSWIPKYSPFSPEALFAEIVQDWKKQEELFRVTDGVFLLKYENLVKNYLTVWEQIREFVQSPLERPGDVGAFHKSVPRGKYEVSLHKGEVTQQSCERWRKEEDLRTLERATKFADLMGQTGYLDFWGYKL